MQSDAGQENDPSNNSGAGVHSLVCCLSCNVAGCASRKHAIALYDLRRRCLPGSQDLAALQTLQTLQTDTNHCSPISAIKFSPADLTAVAHLLELKTIQSNQEHAGSNTL